MWIKTIFRFIRYNLNICSSMFCSKNPVLILLNICLYKKILRKNIEIPWFCGVGVAKTITSVLVSYFGYSSFTYTPTKKIHPLPNLSNSTQNQAKSQIFNLKPVIVPHIVKIKQNQYFYICQNLFLKDLYF